MTDKVFQLIPAELGQRLRTRARKSTELKMENFIELRDFFAENKARIEETGLMTFYEEAGDWLNYGGDAVRKYLGIIRDYPESKLREWVKGDLSFYHIDMANFIQNDSQFDAAQILDAAITLGNGNGRRMTVNEMIAFAVGEKVKRSPQFHVIRTLTGWIDKLPLKMNWDDAKKKSFSIDVNLLIKRYFS